jgi:ribosome-associated protein
MEIPGNFEGRSLESEFVYTSSRSSGPGGQNVNKLNTRIELRINIPGSRILTDIEKAILLNRLKNRITNDGDLIVVSQSERSQLGNKKKATERLYGLLSKACDVRPKRIPTSPTQGSKTKRLESKQKRSATKKLRSRTKDSEE